MTVGSQRPDSETEGGREPSAPPSLADLERLRAGFARMSFREFRDTAKPWIPRRFMEPFFDGASGNPLRFVPLLEPAEFADAIIALAWRLGADG